MITIPFENIETLAGVRTFFDWIMGDLHVSMSPEIPFEDYVDREGNSSFTETEYLRLNELLNQCWRVCRIAGVDIYTIALESDADYRKRRGFPPLNFPE